jgi:amidophosphoribosyltransferase
MSKMRDFVAFQALVELLKDTNQENLLQEAYQRCKNSEHLPVEAVRNEVTELYDHFEYNQISHKIAELVRPKDLKPELHLIFQTLDGLHSACLKNSGDWYFSGQFPKNTRWRV